MAFAPFNFHPRHFPSARNSFQRILIKTSLHIKQKCLFGVFKEFQLFEVTLIRTPSGVADRERGGGGDKLSEAGGMNMKGNMIQVLQILSCQHLFL